MKSLFIDQLDVAEEACYERYSRNSDMHYVIDTIPTGERNIERTKVKLDNQLGFDELFSTL